MKLKVIAMASAIAMSAIVTPVSANIGGEHSSITASAKSKKLSAESKEMKKVKSALKSGKSHRYNAKLNQKVSSFVKSNKKKAGFTKRVPMGFSETIYEIGNGSGSFQFNKSDRLELIHTSFISKTMTYKDIKNYLGTPSKTDRGDFYSHRLTYYYKNHYVEVSAVSDIIGGLKDTTEFDAYQIMRYDWQNLDH